MSKHFKSLQEFQEATLTRLKPILKEPGLIIKVQNIIGGDTEWAAAEMRADAECVNGKLSVCSRARCTLNHTCSC